ncbi:MAG: YfhO family protein, partial [bacterium]|nr:YfhO family protein [bacterium]
MKKWKIYTLTSSIVLGILLIVFAAKGIFPFGSNSLIWGDMHDQVTAFYYHFYDSFYGSNSLLVNFSTSSSINFIGILAYYILSPFSFIILLFPRDQIYLMVSIIVALKILTASLTCLYFIRTYFKNLPAILSILLAIIYAFSGYGLIMYQITPW